MNAEAADISPAGGDKDFLLQNDLIEDVLPRIGREQWQTLYSNEQGDQCRLTFWCALLEQKAVDAAMSRCSRDLQIGDGLPCFIQSQSSGYAVSDYHRFDSSEGVRPLVLSRSFHGAFPPYFELDEEFRLYHNLAEDRNCGLLLSFDTSGRKIEVARIENQRIRVLLKYLRQFQAGTGLNVAIYFESVRYSQVPLVDVPENERERETTEDFVRWCRTIATCDSNEGFDTISRLYGKVILDPPSRDKAGIWPFSEESKNGPDVTFIVGTDSNGNSIESTANPETPHFRTLVYFRREVLGKYFAETDRYRLEDGHLSCLSLWSCRIDNDHDSYVGVLLGDLGQNLPYEEQLHWRQFNVPPEDGMSETQFRRGFLAEFANAKTPDLLFRREYARLIEQWQQVHGWSLFLQPSIDDQHLLNMIHLPVTESQNEFDDQVICLTKLLVEFLNERELETRVDKLDKGVKGIGKLAAFLETTAFPQSTSIIKYLKDLHRLRSAGSAH